MTAKTEALDQACIAAAAEKESGIHTEAYFAETRARASREEFLRILNREGGEAPREGDELPE